MAQYLAFDTQPIGAEGSPLGAKASAKLHTVVEITGLSLQIPCYVMDSSKPIWQGKVWNCKMIMGTNVLVGFNCRIAHSNGIEVITESLLQQLTQAGNLLEPQKLSEEPTIELLVSQESVSLPASLSEVPSLPLQVTQ